jgi:hypothetical protein
MRNRLLFILFDPGGDMVIILFDAAATTKDGQPYRNTYT